MSERVTKMMACGTGVLLALRHCTWVPVPLAVAGLLLLALAVAGLQRRVRICWALVAFMGVYGLSLLLNLQPATAIRVQRFAAFTLGMLALSPLIVTARLARMRRLVLNSFLITLMVMVCASSLMWVFATVTHQSFHDGNYYMFGFRGVFQMGMSMAPAATIVTIWNLNLLLDRFTDSAAGWHRGKLFSILPAWSCLAAPLMLIAAGSRICLVACGVSCVMLLILRRKAVGKMAAKIGRKRILAGSLGFLILIGVTAPLTTVTLRFKISKNQNHSILYSREKLWGARIAEFESSPWLGIGFAREFPRQGAEDDILYGSTKSDLSEIEPGSSYLTLLSYGGIAGTLAFVWFLVLMARRLRNFRARVANAPFLLSVMLFLAFNALTEGWLMFAGALLFPVFWLITSAFFPAPDSEN